MANSETMNCWEQIRLGVSDVERLIGQKSYNLAMIKARQTLEIMVKNQMLRHDVPGNDLAEAIDNLYESRVISAKTRDNYHRIRLIGNAATHDGDSNANNANTSYHLLSQEVYTFANAVKNSQSARRSSSGQKSKKKQRKNSFDLDLGTILKILIPILAVIIIILVIKGIVGNKKEEAQPETTEMQIEYATIEETEAYTVPETSVAQLETEPEVPKVWVTTDHVNVRTAPSTDSGRLAVLAPDTEVDFIEDTGSGWIKINYEGTEAYISKDYAIEK